MSNEQVPHFPTADEQIAQGGIIDQVPGAESIQIPVQSQGREQSVEVKHGGYATGVRVGEMALKISRLQQMGKMEEAQALADRLEEVSPAQPHE